MAKYYDENIGVVFDTSISKQEWKHKFYNGTYLYLSSKGKYYLVIGSKYCFYKTNKEAAAWLLENGYDIPQDLLEIVKEIVE